MPVILLCLVVVFSLGSNSVNAQPTVLTGKIAGMPEKTDCVELETDRNKNSAKYSEYVKCKFDNEFSKIYSIYSRNLRKNPNNEGDVLIDIHIEKDGSITHVEILETEIKSADALKKILLRAKRVKLLGHGFSNIKAQYFLAFTKVGK